MTDERVDDQLRDRAPSAEEIEERLRAPLVKILRPLIWGGIFGLKSVRRFSWDAQFEQDLLGLDQPLVFAANHRSHADTAAILDTLPRPICKRTVVAAALDVFGPDSSGGRRRKLTKDCLQLIVAAGFHAFAFDRHGPPLRSVRTSTQLIRHGWSLLLFPEGTRSRTGEMAPFKAGVGVLSRFTGRPVIPVHVAGGEHVLPYCGFMPRAGRVLVRYGAPMWYQADDSPTSFVNRLQEHVRELGARAAQEAAALSELAHPLPQKA